MNSGNVNIRTIEEAISSGKGLLRDISSTPRLDAELLLSEVMGLGRASLLARSREILDANLEERYFSYIARRCLHEPVAYITGRKEFFGLDFFVNASVLIPRPETELVVELAIPRCYQKDTPSLVLDLGTGSGCIAVALAYELKKFKLAHHIVAVDNDDNALKVAENNISRHKLSDNISLIKSNWFSALAEFEGKFDLIVTNPPYIADGDNEMSPETNFEPQHALFAGDTGLDDIKHLITNCRKFLKPNGALVCEMGSGQREAVQEICEELFAKNHIQYRLSFSKDLAGLDRVFELSFS
jgi:release factor glutamine methyltransferase